MPVGGICRPLQAEGQNCSPPQDARTSGGLQSCLAWGTSPHNWPQKSVPVRAKEKWSFPPGIDS